MSNAKQTIIRRRNLGIIICSTIMMLGLFVGLLFFLRPATSTIEKRELTPFPSITLASFLDGSFFTNVSLWYADTYPLREPMVGAAQNFKNLYGIQPKVKLLGGNMVADEIGGSPSSKTPLQETPTSQTYNEIDAPEAKAMDEAMQQQLMGGLYLKDGAAYNIYYFVDESAELYIDAVNTLAHELEGQARVYSLLIPNGSAIMLDEEELNALGGSDQKQAIEYYYGRYSDLVHPVGLYDTLREHSDEYLFFRTDHHWTQTAAYYSYLEFCKASGKEANDIFSWESMTFDNFLGTFYTETNDPSLIADTVTAYIPPSTNEITFTDSDGSEVQSHIINDVSEWGQGTGYYCYGIGDYQLTHVINPRLNDGSSCLLLKDSYGNCLAPELVEHYQDLWVIDYRYSDTDIVEFARNHGITDVVIENNITIASTVMVAQALNNQVRKTSSAASETSNEAPVP